jgi:hypothetical protein
MLAGGEQKHATVCPGVVAMLGVGLHEQNARPGVDRPGKVQIHDDPRHRAIVRPGILSVMGRPRMNQDVPALGEQPLGNCKSDPSTPADSGHHRDPDAFGTLTHIFRLVAHTA